MKNEKSLTSAQQEIHCNSIPKEKIEKRIHLIGNNDSDWARDMDDKKRVLVVLYSIWVILCLHRLLRSKPKYVAATFSVCHATWLRSLLKELQKLQEEATKIFVNNKSTLTLAKNLVFHYQSKHINTRVSFYSRMYC